MWRVLKGFRVLRPLKKEGKCFSGFVYSDEVRDAKNNGMPIVALETTIVTHGMPYPDNYKTAVNVENVIRSRVRVLFFTGKI